MFVEKRVNNTIWYNYGYYSFKVNILENGNAIVWVNFKGYNIAFPLIVRGFLDVLEEYDLDVVVNFDWNEHRGFEVKQEEVDLLLGEILNFCIENNPETMNLKALFSNDEWDK